MYRQNTILYILMEKEFQSYFDKKVWKNGNSFVIVIPSDTFEKLKLKEGDILEIGIRKCKK